MSDWTVRAEDNGEPLLDNDGNVIRELAPESVDELLDHGQTLRDLASASRSWRFGHVIVDEAQDLTPMQWRMVARRSRGNSMTIVGDLAQRSIGDPGTWPDHLPSAIADFDYRELTTNYRSPAEIADLAAQVLAELAPGLPAPRALRSSGRKPRVIRVDHIRQELPLLIRSAQADAPDGRVAVIGAQTDERVPDMSGVTWLSPWDAKGLEFDAVVVVEPARIAAAENGLSLLYVAVTRSTQTLTVVHSESLPACLIAAA